MVFLSTDRKGLAVARFARPFATPNLADFAILALIGAAAVLVVHGVQDMDRPLTQLQSHPVTLELARLPGYAIDTTLRMFAAILCSLVFTFVVGSLAAKSRKAALVVVPALDVLQSVPVLGFLTFTFVFFLNLFPGSELGAECASIFLVFTAQATLVKSRRSMARASHEPMPGRVTVLLPTVMASEATTKNQPPDIDIMVFQIRPGMAKGSSSLRNLSQGDRPNWRLAWSRSPGRVRSDW